MSDNGDGFGVGIEAWDVDYLLVGDAADTDVLVNSAHLYGDTAGILDQAVVDGHQGGYDVLTSGYLSGFGEIMAAPQRRRVHPKRLRIVTSRSGILATGTLLTGMIQSLATPAICMSHSKALCRHRSGSPNGKSF